MARTLKYSVPETDYNALERELASARDPHEDELAKWSEYLDDDAEDQSEDDYHQKRA